MSASPFAGRVVEAMRARGLTLRRLCRDVGLDASFFSKVLAGKRSPPTEEEVLRRIARCLELDAAELVVAAGRIPQEWQGLWRDPALFRDVHALATNRTATAFTTEDAEDAEALHARLFSGERSRSRSQKKMKPRSSSSESSVSSVVQAVAVDVAVSSRAPADLDTELL